jgi:hypothetical protein
MSSSAALNESGISVDASGLGAAPFSVFSFGIL